MDFSILNDEQKEAVVYNEGPLLIVAGAGSGKTRVITYKIAYLLEQGVNPAEILAITFTNKAANEMKERVETLINDNTKRVFVSTFHKFCMRVLREHIEKIGLSRDFTIYDTDDQKKLMKECIKDVLRGEHEKIKPVSLLRTLSYYKNHGLTLNDLKKDYSDNDLHMQMYDCIEHYENLKLNRNILDFDDILLFTVRVLKESEEARNKVNARFKYILVDEYQDTNIVQFELISLLTKRTNKITCVGDEDQSIYKFRGANIGNILSFEEVFKDAKLIYLTKNYRSTNNILNVANSIIKNNKSRKDKKLWSDNGDGAVVTFTEYYDDNEEARKVIENIKNQGSYKDTAILYRTNAQSRRFEDMCVYYQIPYILIGGVNFYERKEVKDILSYLKILANRNDLISFERIINVPKRGVGASSVNKIRDFAIEKNIDFIEACEKASEIGLSGKILKGVETFVKDINDIENEPSIVDMIYKILKLGYSEYLIDEYGKDEAKDREDNIGELVTKAATFNMINGNLSDEVENTNVAFTKMELLQEFLYEISLVEDIENLRQEEEKITLMTLHGSKGLEFDTVYLVGLNEGLFPSYQSMMSDDPSDLEEERRLCYVGITRARKNLYLTSAHIRMINGKTNFYDRSRFVDEIDDDLVTKKFLSNASDDFSDSFIDYGKTFRKNSFSYGDNFKYNKKYDDNYNSSFDMNYDNDSIKQVDYKKKYKEVEEKVKEKIELKKGKDLAKPEVLSYKVGDRVSHIKFGEGVVLDIKDIGKDYEVTIKFDEGEEKTLFAAFAKLEKVEGV